MNRIINIIFFLLFFFLVAPGKALPGFQTNQNFSVSPYFDDREDLYDVKFYFLDLQVTNQSTFIAGSATITAESLAEQLDSFVVELFDFYVIDSVLIQGIRIQNFSHRSGLLIVPVPQGHRADDLMRLKVFYHGQSSGSGFFNGISNTLSFENQKKVTYTLSEPFQASEWFPVKQSLDDKADSAWIFITVDTSLMAGSNGVLTRKTPLPGGKIRYEWKTRYPIAYYLISMAVADYREYSYYVHVGSDSVFFQNFIYDTPSYLAQNKADIDKTADLLKLYSEKFGMYPFAREKYGHSTAPMGGGMENQTMTTLHNFRFGLVAHELAHQWFGDKVTCASWKDIWINEGFASYVEYIAYDELISHGEAIDYLKEIGAGAMAIPEGSVVIPDNQMDNELRIFNVSLTYYKGAYLLHMFRQEINNDDMFYRILRRLLAEHGDNTASVSDFISIAEDESDLDWNWFFDQWYYGKGFPVFTGEWEQSAGLKVRIEMNQAGSSSSTPFFRTHMEYKLVYTDGKDTTIRILFDKPETVTSIQVSKQVKNIITDPEEKVLKRAVLNYTKGKGFVHSIKPNPFHDNITIGFEDNTKVRTITITSLSGRTIFTTGTSKVKEQINLSQFPPGLYLITVEQEGKKVTEKIIKQ